jgi:plastocyanin
MMRTRILFSLLMTTVLATPSFATEPVIGQKDKQFSQEIVLVKHGETVEFLNDDGVGHNISVHEPDGAIRPGLVQQPGGDIHVPFDKVGDHDIRCLIHPKMKMVVRVD